MKILITALLVALVCAIDLYLQERNHDSES